MTHSKLQFIHPPLPTYAIGKAAIALLLVVFSLTLVSCNPAADTAEETLPPQADAAAGTPAPPPSGTPRDATAPEETPATGATPGSNPTSENSVPTESAASLPAAVEAAVRQDIATQNNVPIDALIVDSARPQTWPDGCLGLGGPDDICTFALVDGWEVTVSQGDKQWIYRTDGQGLLVLPVKAGADSTPGTTP